MNSSVPEFPTPCAARGFHSPMSLPGGFLPCRDCGEDSTLERAIGDEGRKREAEGETDA